VLKSDVTANGLMPLIASIKKEDAMDNNLMVTNLEGQTFKVRLTPQRGRPRSRKTVAVIFEMYKKSIRFKEQSADLKEMEERYFRLHILPFMGSLFDEDVADVLQDYVNHREKVGTKPDSLAKETRSLAKAIREDNPNWHKPRLRYSNEAKRTNLGFRVKELVPVLEAVVGLSKRYGTEYARVGLVAACTSMRLKDIVELDNRSLDRINWKITFVQSKVKNILKARKSFKTSKPITIDVCDKLKDLFNKISATKKGTLFNVPSAKAVSTVYQRAFKDCGIKGSFHSFRHAAATTMLANGANIKVVQDILGHANINTTMKYLHALDDQKKDAINSIEW
jgi:integrase